MRGFFREGAALLEAGQDLVYAAVLTKHGSAPSGPGARMLVLRDRIIGTVGGGGVEGDVIDHARNVTFTDHRPVIRYYDLMPKDGKVSEYICGGGNEILIAFMDHTDSDTMSFFREAAEAEEKHLRSWLIYAADISGVGRESDTGSLDGCPCSVAVSIQGKGVFGHFDDDGTVFRDMVENPIRIAVHGDYDEHTRFIVDPLNLSDRLIIFGGGHVSYETAKLAKGLDFDVTVVDDRSEFSNNERFPDCTCITVPSFDEIPEIDTDETTYILVMTRGHMCDMEALRWALDRAHGYLGMIGSVSKRDLMYERLRGGGYDGEQLSAVHCPVGLKLGAKTPAEIAVSIGAELISYRYNSVR